MKYTSVLNLIEDQVKANGQGYTNMFDKEMAMLVFGDKNKKSLVKKELISLKNQGKIKIEGNGKTRKITL